jgi:hypothetical protein
LAFTPPLATVMLAGDKAVGGALIPYQEEYAWWWRIATPRFHAVDFA